MFNRLIFDHEMCNFLERANNRKITSVLLHGMSGLISEEGNFICRESGSIDTLSYLPKSKYKLVDSKDPFSEGIGRVNIKFGRFLKKFLSKSAFSELNITDSEIEKFVNFFKSYFNSSIDNLKVVEGDDILKYYLQDNYFSPNGNMFGTLWNSCMRQRERNKFMKIYAANPDIKMLVMLTEDGQVRSRALLWENVYEHGSDRRFKFMDRVYSVYDHDVDTFKEWAKQNGYISKWEQSAKSELLFYLIFNFFLVFNFFSCIPRSSIWCNSKDSAHFFTITVTNKVQMHFVIHIWEDQEMLLLFSSAM